MIHFELCNYCRIRLKKKTKEDGWKITRLRSSNGVTVYCHPETVNIKKLKGLKRGKYYVTFYEKKPKDCCCSR